MVETCYFLGCHFSVPKNVARDMIIKSDKEKSKGTILGAKYVETQLKNSNNIKFNNITIIGNT